MPGRPVVTLLVLVAVAGVAASVWLGLGPLLLEDDDGDPRAVAADYLAAWEQKDWAGMRALVADPPAGFDRVHADTFDRLGVETARFALAAFEVTGERARAGYTARLDLAGLGEWRYRGVVRLRSRDGRWLVDWAQSTLHPALEGEGRLERRRTWPERAPIVAHDGTPLVEPREVIVVGVEPRRIENRGRMLRALERLAGADPAKVVADLDAPGVQPDWFIPVTALRPEEYEQVRARLRPVPGVVFRRELARLAPADGFAHHVIGEVGEVTAELLEALGEPYAAGDVVGLFGLERRFERELAGAPSGRVEAVDGAGRRELLHRFRGQRPRPLRTTLDTRTQAAADAALARVGRPAALVAVDVETGAVRAVASRPLPEFDRALAGRYPPGSTFKIVTAAALLAAGATAGDLVECPRETRVGGRVFRNANGTPTGSIPFSSAFAVSCNTAFVELGAALDPDALADAAERFGFGAAYDLPLDAAGGSFPAPRDEAERAAAAIGQARVEASPLHMATVAAAVASGAWRPPSLLAGDGAGDAQPLDPAVAGALAELMRLVVTDGTGRAADIPQAAVAGKTGSAEFGDGGRLRTHAWFVGFTEELAFAVLVEGGGGGGEVAAPIAARFVRALR